jgi:hypothetical protein
MSLEDELRRREEELGQQLRELGERQRVIEDELDHIRALRQRHNGNESYRIPYRGSQVNWRRMCEDHNIQDLGDSGHRDAIRHLSDLHSSVPHYCIYHRRQYP